MANKANKSKSVVLLVAGMVAAVLVTLIANRQSPYKELQLPLNNGVARLFTYKNQLVAVTQDSQMYAWNWSNLNSKPVENEVDAEQSVMVSPDTVISIKEMNARAISVRKLGNDKSSESIQLAGQSSHSWLGSNRDKSSVVVVVEEPGPGNELVTFSLLKPDWQNLRYEQIVKVSAEKTSRVFHATVSNNGKYALMTGQKEKKGWIVLADMTAKSVIYDKQIADFEKVGFTSFAPDDKFIYARTHDSTLYKIDVGSAAILDRWSGSPKNEGVMTCSSVQDVGVSPDGRIAASIVSETLVVWDSQAGRIILKRVPHHKIESGLALSPDGRFVATSDLRQGGTIKIWQCPPVR